MVVMSQVCMNNLSAINFVLGRFMLYVGFQQVVCCICVLCHLYNILRHFSLFHLTANNMMRHPIMEKTLEIGLHHLFKPFLLHGQSHYNFV